MTNALLAVLATMNLEVRPIYADVCTNLCDDCRMGLSIIGKCNCKFEKVFTGRYEIVDKKAEDEFIDKMKNDKRKQIPNPV